jgi:hypothetical protein
LGGPFFRQPLSGWHGIQHIPIAPRHFDGAGVGDKDAQIFSCFRATNKICRIVKKLVGIRVLADAAAGIPAKPVPVAKKGQGRFWRRGWFLCAGSDKQGNRQGKKRAHLENSFYVNNGSLAWVLKKRIGLGKVLRV